MVDRGFARPPEYFSTLAAAEANHAETVATPKSDSPPWTVMASPDVLEGVSSKSQPGPPAGYHLTMPEPSKEGLRPAQPAKIARN